MPGTRARPIALVLARLRRWLGRGGARRRRWGRLGQAAPGQLAEEVIVVGHRCLLPAFRRGWFFFS